MFWAIVTDDVACRQNKEVTDQAVALRRGLYLEQTLHPVCSCLDCTMLFAWFGTYDNRKKFRQVPPGKT